MERSKVAIVIPIFNEERTIENLLFELKKIGSLILVDDCSNDSTPEILKKYNAKVIRNIKNLGYDKSLKKGLIYASRKRYKYIVTIDADGEHNVKDVKKVLVKLNDYDVVYTNRQNIFRYSEKIIKYFSKIMFRIEDPLSGLKGYRINMLKNYNFKNWDGTFGSDILIFAKLKNFRLAKINIKIKRRVDKSRIGNNILINLSILKLLVIFFIKTYNLK